jgi:hypothetical protein
MLIQILSHTPVYVWAILALLVYRGVIAMRERDMTIRKLFIIPAVMLALSLQDIVAKFGGATVPLCAWAGAVLVVALLVCKYGSAGASAGGTPGSLRIHGSAVPLVMMMAIFFTKYATAVLLAVQPQASQHALLPAAACALFGMFNGYFLGRLAANLRTWQSLRAPAGGSRRLAGAA